MASEARPISCPNSMLAGREHFYSDFRSAVTRLAECDTVLDLGTTYRFRKELEPFSAFFKGYYVALDYRAQRSFGERNVNVDGDIQALPFASGSVDGVLCIEVLEHLPKPQTAVDEIHRVLRPGGLLLLTTPFLLSYHGKPGDYSDFYRYTDEGLKWLLRHFTTVSVRPLGGLPYRLLNTVTPSFIRKVVDRSAMAMGIVNALDRRFPTRSPLRWLVWAER
jgi:SAM-dependent methyltransferase